MMDIDVLNNIEFPNANDKIDPKYFNWFNLTDKRNYTEYCTESIRELIAAATQSLSVIIINGIEYRDQMAEEPPKAELTARQSSLLVPCYNSYKGQAWHQIVDLVPASYIKQDPVNCTEDVFDLIDLPTNDEKSVSYQMSNVIAAQLMNFQKYRESPDAVVKELINSDVVKKILRHRYDEDLIRKFATHYTERSVHMENIGYLMTIKESRKGKPKGKLNLLSNEVRSYLIQSQPFCEIRNAVRYLILYLEKPAVWYGTEHVELRDFVDELNIVEYDFLIYFACNCPSWAQSRFFPGYNNKTPEVKHANESMELVINRPKFTSKLKLPRLKVV